MTSACLFFACASSEEEVQTKEFVSIHKIGYQVEGRYETLNEYISFSNSGTTITFKQYEDVFSISIEDLADDTANTNWLSVIVADTIHSRIQLKKGKHVYDVSAPTNKNQLICFVKTTEAFVGEVKVFGLEMFQPKPTELLHVKRSMNIQFIGNSITCGYGNMVSIEAPPTGNPLTGFHSENENAYLSYAMQAARMLDASPTLVSFSGKGMYRNFDSDTIETMPKIYNRIHLQKKTSANWDSLTVQIPDIIVINLGTNDFFGESKNIPLNDAVFIKTYIAFVARLIKLYPTAKIICANGSMMNDAWPEGKYCWTRMQLALTTVCKHFEDNGDTAIYPFFFTPQQAPFGEDYHPSLVTHSKMAKELTIFIQTEVIQ